MHIDVFGWSAADAADGIKKFASEWASMDRAPSFVAVHHQSGAIGPELRNSLSALTPALHMATSCNGVMFSGGTAEIGLFAISDPDGDYGTTTCAFDGDVATAAAAATQDAIVKAGRSGEAPDLIWVSATPGNEEDAIRGIEGVVGAQVPIIGGSAADDDVSGAWSVSDGGQTFGAGMVVSVLFCSTPLHFAYQNGYEPTQNSGVATKVEGRKLIEIDHRPAGSVYAEWTNSAFPKHAQDASLNILADATFWPLGRTISALGDIPNYLLAHPASLNADGSIDLFAEIEEGETLTQMLGEPTALADRAGRVADFALRSDEVDPDTLAGALMVYCGGCMLGVQDRIADVYSGVNAALYNRPFLGVFTFGEQGPVYGAGNRHGNLMISCIAFTRSG